MLPFLLRESGQVIRGMNKLANYTFRQLWSAFPAPIAQRKDCLPPKMPVQIDQAIGVANMGFARGIGRPHLARSCAHFKNASAFSTFMPNTDEASTHENDGWLADRAKTPVSE